MGGELRRTARGRAPNKEIISTENRASAPLPSASTATGSGSERAGISQPRSAQRSGSSGPRSRSRVSILNSNEDFGRRGGNESGNTRGEVERNGANRRCVWAHRLRREEALAFLLDTWAFAGPRVRPSYLFRPFLPFSSLTASESSRRLWRRRRRRTAAPRRRRCFPSQSSREAYTLASRDPLPACPSSPPRSSGRRRTGALRFSFSSRRSRLSGV